MTFLLESPEIIEGIGPSGQEKLAENGITNIAQMFAARARNVHAVLNDRSPQQIGSLFCAAMLLRVEELTPNMAEAFVRYGIRSVPELAEAGLQTVERAVQASIQENRINEEPSIYELAALQREAWRTRARGMLAGQIFDHDGNPISGAMMEVGQYDRETNSDGWYAFDHLPEGKSRITLTLSQGGRSFVLGFVKITPGKLKLLAHHIGPRSETSSDETVLDEMDGHYFSHRRSYRNKLVTLPLSEFREQTLFLVRDHRSEGEVRLLNMYKKQVGNVTLIERTVIPRTLLPENTNVGDVVKFEGGVLVETDLSPSAVSELKRKRWIESYVTTQ